MGNVKEMWQKQLDWFKLAQDLETVVVFFCIA
jgi:hypothetical protein